MLGEIAELKRQAHRRLPKAVFDFLEGGAGDERDLMRNTQALADITFEPRRLVDVSNINASTQILNKSVAAPFYISPTGMNGVLWPSGDIALARAAARANIPFVLSTASNTTMEKVTEASTGETWFQLFPLSPEIMENLISRAEGLGIDVLVLTVDVPVNGDRRRDKSNGFQLPFKLTSKFCWDAVLHPQWALGVVQAGIPTLAHMSVQNVSSAERMALLGRNMDASFSWKNLSALRKRWKGKLLVKGLWRADDIEQCGAIGVDGVVISNHGGRQLDDQGAPIGRLNDLPTTTGVEVFLDGGFANGADFAKAMAMGANGVGVGRAVLYGLAANGEDGAYSVIEALKQDFNRTLTLLGCPSTASLNSDFIAEIYR